MAKDIKQNNKPRMFGLWLGVSLVCGLITAGLLVGLIWATFQNIIGSSETVITYEAGQFFVGLIAALVVFGVLYAIGTFKAGRDLEQKRKENDAVKILSIVYAVFLGIPAVIMLVLFIIPLVRLGVGTYMDINYTIADLVCSVVSFAILGKMALYQLGIWNKLMGRKAWTVAFCIFTVAIIALFMVFPGAKLRDVTRDQMTVNDLEKIEFAIRDYHDMNNELPSGLDVLDISGLNNSLDSFKYSIKESTNESYQKFEICADFLTNTGSIYRYTFETHPSGNVCFEREVYFYDIKPMPAEPLIDDSIIFD